MKKLFSSFAVLLFSVAVFAQIPTKCFEIESILVDACSNPEGENEMVRFKVGPNPLNANNLNVEWPTATNPWLGNCQNATTANLVTALNATIQGCGRVIEPAGGILPAGAQVILITSTNLQVLANSFANLNDTIYAIFQCSGNTAGHFGNSGTGLRTLTMSFNPPSGCGDTVTYDRALLININGTTGGSSALQEGSSVNYSWNGTPSYYNNGCVAPIVELLISINGDSCANSAKTFSLSSNTNVNNISWNFGNPASGVNNTANTLSAPHTFTGPGTYTITATITGACGTYTKDTTISLVSCGTVCNPTAQVTSVGTCVENAVSFTATADSSIASVNWNFGDPSSPSNTATGTSTNHLFSSIGTYTVTAVVTATCGTVTTATYTINVITCTTPCNPTAQITSVGTCVENAVSFAATADSTIASVSWNFGDLSSPNNTANGTSTTHLFSGIGTYTVTATVTANCGTVTTATYTINIITCTIPCNPTSAITSVGTCIENEVSFTATADSAIASVSWNFGDPSSASNTSNGTSTTHLFSAVGTYTVTATVTTTCGTVTTATYTVNIVTCVNPNPICEATISSSFSCLDFPATFAIATDSSILSVNWNFDDPNSNNNTASGVTTAHEFSAPGSYNVTSIVELSCGFDTLSRLVQVDTCVTPPTDLCPALSIPNAFTPNGDGKNDDFKILNPASYQSLQLNVFNRWGELVFSGNASSAWDGTFRGQSQPVAVYVYTATGVCLNGKKVGMNGSVTLLR
jgi:gliding motility-associated-like protein